VFGKTVSTEHRTPFHIKADKTGYRSKEGKEVSFFASYCPFCGKATQPLETTES
jgi:hypothetical protein